MKSNVKFFNNDEGVSPIIATLVLIVVAIIGAAAVGLIVGSFSNNVSNQAAGDGGATQATAKLTIAGSTTVKPVVDVLAQAYMRNYTGVQVVTQAGGSGVGIASAGQDLVDIGMASEPLSMSTSASSYPNLKENVIGKGAVVIIGNDGLYTALTDHNVTKTDLQEVYAGANAGTHTAPTNAALATVTAVYRSDSSGTQTVLSQYLFGTSNLNDNRASLTTVPGVTYTGASGNAGVFTAVTGVATGNAIGFVDFEYAISTSGAAKTNILGINDGSVIGTPVASGASTSTLKANILKAAKSSTATSYPAALVRPLVLLTNGNPSAIEQSFINFCKDPQTRSYYSDIGLFHILDYSS